MDYEEELEDAYDPDLFEEFGEGFEDDFDAVSEEVYEEAFNRAQAQEQHGSPSQENQEYQMDSVVGARDKKPVMSLLNKGKLSKFEMDELLNEGE